MRRKSNGIIRFLNVAVRMTWALMLNESHARKTRRAAASGHQSKTERSSLSYDIFNAYSSIFMSSALTTVLSWSFSTAKKPSAPVLK
jgi:hypothetical protein